MAKRTTAAITALMLAIATPASLSAQDAAETAIIIAGTSAPQASGARGLGGAISGSMRRAAGVINLRSGGAQAPRGATRQDAARTLPEGVDALEGTDAPAYKVGSGATIRVSGRLNPSARTVCTRNCETTPAPPTRETSPEAGDAELAPETGQ